MIKPSSILLFAFVLFSANTFASDYRKTAINKAGDQKIDYTITKIVDGSGDSNYLIEYQIVTQVNSSIPQVKSVMDDVSRYKNFTGDDSSEAIGLNSHGEDILYFFTKAPWPIRSFEKVLTLQSSENKTSSSTREVQYRMWATPNALEMGKTQRFEKFETTYVFSELDEGTINVTMSSKFVTPFRIPGWMVKASFPGTIFDLMDALVFEIHS